MNSFSFILDLTTVYYLQFQNAKSSLRSHTNRLICKSHLFQPWLKNTTQRIEYLLGKITDPIIVFFDDFVYSAVLNLFKIDKHLIATKLFSAIFFCVKSQPTAIMVNLTGIV